MKNSEIGEVLKGGTVYRSTSFLLRATPSQKIEKPAYIVSKKVFKTAVERNNIRRRFRAALSPFLKKVQRQKLVISVGQESKNKTVGDINVELEKLFTKSGMLN